MRFNYLTIKDGKPKIIWPAMFTFVASVHVVVVTASEAFWYVLTGSFSALIGGFALVAATLIVIRVVGASMTMPTYQLESRLKSLHP
jgi:hypothetical protein